MHLSSEHSSQHDEKSFKQVGARSHSQIVQEPPEVRLARFDRYFDYQSLETRHGSHLGHKFGKHFSTDGLAVSVMMTRWKVGLIILEVLPLPLVCKQPFPHC